MENLIKYADKQGAKRALKNALVASTVVSSIFAPLYYYDTYDVKESVIAYVSSFLVSTLGGYRYFFNSAVVAAIESIGHVMYDDEEAFADEVSQRLIDIVPPIITITHETNI